MKYPFQWSFLSGIDRNLWIIILTGLSTHGWLVLNNGIFWDDWVLYYRVVEKDWQSLYEYALQTGLPMVAYVRFWFSNFQNPVFAMRLTALICLVGSGFLTYKIIKDSGLSTKEDAVWVAIFSMIFPSFQAAIFCNVVHYLIGYCLYLASCWLGLRSLRSWGAKKLIQRILSLTGVFFASNLLNSLLVFSLGYFIFLFFSWRKQQNPSRSLVNCFFSFCVRYADYLILPFVSWGLKQTLFPRYGIYSDFNQFRLIPEEIAMNLLNFVYYGIYQPLNQSLLRMYEFPLFGIILLLGLIYLIKRFIPDKIGQFGILDHARTQLFFGMFLFFLALIPYVLVAKSPDGEAVNSRHALLTALPVGIMIVSLTRLLFAGANPPLSRMLGYLVLWILCINFWISDTTAYLDWQQREIKDRSIITNLLSMKDVKAISIFWINDKFPAGGEEYYRPYEWAGIFKQIWNGQKWVGFDTKYYERNALQTEKDFYIDRYSLRDLDLSGCQANMSITPIQGAENDLSLTFQYFYHRVIKPDELQGFLMNLTTIRVKSYPTKQAANCSTNLGLQISQ